MSIATWWKARKAAKVEAERKKIADAAAAAYILRRGGEPCRSSARRYLTEDSHPSSRDDGPGFMTGMVVGAILSDSGGGTGIPYAATSDTPEPFSGGGGSFDGGGASASWDDSSSSSSDDSGSSSCDSGSSSDSGSSCSGSSD